MGNNASSAKGSGSDRVGTQAQAQAQAQAHSPASTLQRERTERRRHHQQHTEHYYGTRQPDAHPVRRSTSNGREPRRRESLQALSSSAKAQAAPPSLTSAVAHPTPATSPSQPRTIHPTASSSSPRSRHPSISATTPRRATPDPDDPQDPAAPPDMGAEQSTSIDRDPTKIDHTLKSPSTAHQPGLSPASHPVDVPHAQTRPHNPAPLDPDDQFADYHLPPSSYSRPPRLPLPIEEEVHNPGSPISSPTELDNEPDDLPRRSSVISSTVDDDEEPDNFEGYSTDHAGPKVPTIIEWRPSKPSDRVYVTGTFTNWERKFRLYKDGPSKHRDALSATLQLPPGTHHIKFIANGDMVTSEALPTTVDYTNILVNYIEVSLDQVKARDKSGSTTPTPVPAGPAAPSRPLDIRPRPASPSAQPINTVPNQVAHQPPPQAVQALTARSPSPQSPNPEKPKQSPAVTLVKQPPKNYTSQIPQYLFDLDTYIPSGKEHDASPAAQAARYRIERANAAADSQPAPPSLPMFLSKSILNGTTPMKDDSSVLIMPNHTVLNHLATTNIKQGVLATSSTTRYKRKFLTTIMYKPRSDDGD